MVMVKGLGQGLGSSFESLICLSHRFLIKLIRQKCCHYKTIPLVKNFDLPFFQNRDFSIYLYPQASYRSLYE